MFKGTYALGALAAITVFVAVSPPATAATIAQWAGTPVTVGDKVFTLVSTSFATDGNVTFTNGGGGLFFWSLSPGADKQLTSTTKTMVFRVTIVDDPITPGDEALLMRFGQVSGDGNRFIASGTFAVTWVFDDNSDFSSPLVTSSNAATPWGPSAIGGVVKDVYVRLTFVASGGTTLLTSYSLTFTQASDPTPARSTSWGRIKAVYH